MAYCASMGCSRFAWGPVCSSCRQPFCSQCDKLDHPCTAIPLPTVAALSPSAKVVTAAFDDVLGITSRVHVFSNKHDSHFSGERMYVDGIYSGFKWQCVEFARRWLLLTKGCQFGEVMRASEIWEQKSLINVETGEEVGFRQCPNGGLEPPTPGTLIIYPFEAERTPWGHVGVITHVTADCVGIAEQNLTFVPWSQDEEFGRRVPITRTPEGGYYLHEDDQPPCLGWMVPEVKDRDFDTPLRVLPQFISVKHPGKLTRRAVPETFLDLDLSLPSHALYATTQAAKVPWSAVYDIDEKRGTAGVAMTNEALRLVERALDFMVSSQTHLPDLPKDILQRACESWETQKEMTIYGRLDFGFDGKADKLLGVELDSLSCALIGPLQDTWVVKALGQETPFSLSQYKGDLERSWQTILKETGVKTIYFVETSDNNEQQYNALALYEATAKAGLPCQWLTLDSLKLTEEGVFAPDGAKIELIFKTCPWSSVFLDLGSLRARVLLHRSLLVLEPLWKALLADNFLQLLQQRNPSNELLLREGEEFNFQEPSAGRYPTVGAVIIGGERSASVCKDGADATLSNQGPFGPLWFNIHDR